MKVTRAGKKSAETPEEHDGNAILRTPRSDSLDPDGKVLRS